MVIDPLWEIVNRLTPVQRDLLVEVASAMLRDVQESFNAASDLATPEFRESFRNRLLIHHATNEAKLTKKAFEYAFRAASVAAGRSAFITTSQTDPGADVTVDKVAFSLKTEAAAGIRADRITISKLSEARWIQQCETIEDLAQATTIRIPAHLQQYNRILTLRARNLSAVKVLYELIEIPRAVLLQVQTLTPADFSPRTVQGGSSAKVKVGGEEAFTLRLDGSDGKVTITSLRVDLCNRHCGWTIPTVAPAPDDTPEGAGLGGGNLFSPA